MGTLLAHSQLAARQSPSCFSAGEQFPALLIMQGMNEGVKKYQPSINL